MTEEVASIDHISFWKISIMTNEGDMKRPNLASDVHEQHSTSLDHFSPHVRRPRASARTCTNRHASGTNGIRCRWVKCIELSAIIQDKMLAKAGNPTKLGAWTWFLETEQKMGRYRTSSPHRPACCPIRIFVFGVFGETGRPA
jgi:hypothetical protein